jgi:segregation and condensation protein A
LALDAFEGPLDLLLFLIRRAEVDITDIPIAQVADEYLSILRASTHIDVEAAGEFLVMAATLIELKSRTLMPVEVRNADNRVAAESDPRAALIQQLLDYQRIRIAAEQLGRCKEDAANRVAIRIKPTRLTEPDQEIDIEDVHSMDLAEAYERIASTIDFARLGDHVITMDDTPVALHQADLIDRLERRAGQPMNLLDVFAGCDVAQRVGLFLASLELIRQRRLSVEQDGEGPIMLALQDVEPDDEELILEGTPLDEAVEAPLDQGFATGQVVDHEVSAGQSTNASDA